jgi:hypothetical protein
VKAYGFVADENKSTRHNVSIVIRQLPCWFYFSRPSNTACHDMTTSHKPPPIFRSLLGLGLNFCPTPRFTQPRIMQANLQRFKKDLFTKVFFAGEKSLPPAKLFIRSEWEPDDADIPLELRRRLAMFRRKAVSLFRLRRARVPNLMPSQHAVLKALQESPHTLVTRSDKNLGPAVVERTDYIKAALNDHLYDRSTYQQVSPAHAQFDIGKIRAKVEKFISDFKKVLTKQDHTFLLRSLEDVKDPFPHFYITWKLHKTPLATRPIVSVSGSALHGLGRWLDVQLQPICKALPSFIASSWELKQSIDQLPDLPSHAFIFTGDAVGMYTNISTKHALKVIERFLRTSPICAHLTVYFRQAIMHAMLIIMTSNLFQFGDTYWKQLTGTAMGTPPAPMYATLYYAIHELSFPKHLVAHMPLYKRYIDDTFAIWTGTAAEFLELKLFMNDFGILKWTFSDLCYKVDYLDMTIRLDGPHLRTTIFEKALNLYLYLPPHSAHAPGALSGLIHGLIKRIYRLTTDPADCEQNLKDIWLRLRRRGYSSAALRPLFDSGYANRLTTSDKIDPSTKEIIFLHVPYHPANPPSRVLQHHFRDILRQPRGETPLPRLRNKRAYACGIKRLIVAYHRPRNLSDLLVPRKIDKTKGPPVSAYVNPYASRRGGPRRDPPL